MTQARKTLVDPAQAANYHCVARCVRRSWPCGFDEYLEKSFEHRKPWVEQRILELGGIFACGIYALQPRTPAPVGFALQAYTTNAGSKTAADE